VQREVLGKQLQAFQAALATVQSALTQLQAPVRELERAALEAGRRGAAMSLAAAAQRRGPEPSVAEVVEALQDAWWVARRWLCVCGGLRAASLWWAVECVMRLAGPGGGE
jgi:hypothetical protein